MKHFNENSDASPDNKAQHRGLHNKCSAYFLPLALITNYLLYEAVLIKPRVQQCLLPAFV